MNEDNNQPQRIHYEQNIVNLDLYNTIKDDVTCRICEEVLWRPERCRNCDYSQCGPCLQLVGRRCPNCGAQDDFDNKVLSVQRSLDRLLFSCGQCLQPHSYSALGSCELRLCRECKALIHRDDLLHMCRYECWACNHAFTRVEDLQAHFGQSSCRPRVRVGCEICGSLCNTRKSKNPKDVKNFDNLVIPD